MEKRGRSPRPLLARAKSLDILPVFCYDIPVRHLRTDPSKTSDSRKLRRKGNAVPYIEISTNASLDPAKIETLKAKIAASLAASFPGKTENWLMVRVSAGETMFFAGSPAPCMMVDISLFGAQSKANYQKMTAAVCRLAGDECGIPADRVYVKYSEYDKWGWNGSNF